MKRGLWVLTILGVAVGVAHHQLTAQESEYLRPSSVAFPDKPSNSVDPTDLTQRRVKDLTTPELRVVLKKWHGEEIDQLD